MRLRLAQKTFAATESVLMFDAQSLWLSLGHYIYVNILVYICMYIYNVYILKEKIATTMCKLI